MIAKFDIFKYIVEKALDGIYIISQERLEYVNPAFEKLTGISKEVIHSIGLNFLDRIHPDDQKMLIERRKARREGKAIPSTYEIRGIEKDGTYRYFEFNTVVIPDHPDLVLGIVRDVTERKAAERTRKALRESEIFCDMVMERANEGIAIIQEGRIVYANPFLMRNTGYRKEEIIGKPFHTFVATAYLDQILDYNRRRTSGGAAPSSYEATIKLAGNQRAFVEINVSEMNYQGKPGLFTVIHNITKHKETEIELRDTLAQLREAMNATTEAIARIVEHKDPYTAGHQRRVADLARAIAAEMGLSQEQIDSIRMAGLLHDLGKVSVPSEILTKPTMLTETEFKLIEEHPRVAYDILKSIAFPWPVAEIIYQHHERIDGSGYPRGLKGDHILIEAKVLAVADVMEAMVTHRPYRPAKKIKEALGELADKKGILYDRDAAEACRRLLTEKNFTFRMDFNETDRIE